MVGNLIFISPGVTGQPRLSRVKNQGDTIQSPVTLTKRLRLSVKRGAVLNGLQNVTLLASTSFNALSYSPIDRSVADTAEVAAYEVTVIRNE